MSALDPRGTTIAQLVFAALLIGVLANEHRLPSLIWSLYMLLGVSVQGALAGLNARAHPRPLEDSMPPPGGRRSDSHRPPSPAALNGPGSKSPRPQFRRNRRQALSRPIACRSWSLMGVASNQRAASSVYSYG